MADYLHDDVFDSGLSVLDTLVENLYICYTQPTTFTEASSTYALGVKATPTIGAPSDRTGGGRKVTVSAITDGTVSADGTAAFYGLTDDSTTKLLAAGHLSANQVVSNGNTFTLATFDVGIPDPA